MAGEARGLVVTSQHKGDGFTITTYIPPRRNGGPNVGAYGAAMSALATVVPDAYDPDEAPEQIALADGVSAMLVSPSIAAEMIRDRVLATDEDEAVFPRACQTGGCGDE